MLQVFYFGLPKPLALHDILFVPIGAKDDEVSGWSQWLLVIDIVDYKYIITK
jgi:hypothetical protein